MHKYQPNQTVIVLGIELAFQVGTETSEVADELSGLLTENSIADPAGKILDWQFYPGDPATPDPTWPDYIARLVSLQIAFPAGLEADEVAAELTARFTRGGIVNPDSNIIDWRIRPTLEGGFDFATVTLSEDPEEGEAFALLDAANVSEIAGNAERFD